MITMPKPARRPFGRSSPWLARSAAKQIASDQRLPAADVAEILFID
jgi:hypothetical protein